VQYRCLDRKTLEFVDGGAVVNYQIRNDYIVMNNSIIELVKPSLSKVGDLIAIIKTAGAYVIGCITAVEEKGLSISFKDGKEFFNSNQLNPMRYFFGIDNIKLTVKYDSVKGTADLIKGFFIENPDSLQNLPIEIVTSGIMMTIWRDEENDFNFLDYLLFIFDNCNVVLQFSVIFGVERKIRVRIFANNNTGENIKDNIKLMTLINNEEQQPEKTVCKVLNGTTKEVLATYYLRENDIITTQSQLVYNGNYRVLPPKMVTATLDMQKASSDDLTAYDVALDELRGYVFNHIITADIDRNSQMININRLQIGDGVSIFTEGEKEIQLDGTEETITNETISVFTGLEESSYSNIVTLTFGKGRKKYTDKIQLALRRMYR